MGMSTVLIHEKGGVSHLDDESAEFHPDHTIQALSELLPIVDRRSAQRSDF
jgi:hypothetical protein